MRQCTSVVSNRSHCAVLVHLSALSLLARPRALRSVLADEELQTLYSWVDEVPLSRPKRNIARDFSDGVLVAELVAHYFPHLVELHNYSSANSAQQKGYNWATLNAKVFRKLGFHVDQGDVQEVCTSKAGAIERVLMNLRAKMVTYRPKKGQRAGRTGGGSSGAASMARAPTVHAHPSVNAAAPGAPPAAAADTAASGGTWAGGVGGGGVGGGGSMQQQVDAEILIEKEQDIQELRETVEILEFKVQKLEQLVRLKDAKIQGLTAANAQLQQQ